MGDLAPAPMQRISDDVARTSGEQGLAARRKAPRKVLPAAVAKPQPEGAPDAGGEPEPSHQLDVLA